MDKKILLLLCLALGSIDARQEAAEEEDGGYDEPTGQQYHDTELDEQEQEEREKGNLRKPKKGNWFTNLFTSRPKSGGSSGTSKGGNKKPPSSQNDNVARDLAEQEEEDSGTEELEIPVPKGPRFSLKTGKRIDQPSVDVEEVAQRIQQRISEITKLASQLDAGDRTLIKATAREMERVENAVKEYQRDGKANSTLKQTAQKASEVKDVLVATNGDVAVTQIRGGVKIEESSSESAPKKRVGWAKAAREKREAKSTTVEAAVGADAFEEEFPVLAQVFRANLERNKQLRK